MPPDERLIHDVVRLSKEGMKRRAIARALHIGRNTVRWILAEHGEARAAVHSALPRRRTFLRPSKLDPFRSQIDALFKTYPDITAQRVFEILCETGFDGGYSGVEALVRRIRPQVTPTPSLQTPPRVPGETGERDWSPYEVTFTHAPPMTLQAFGYTLRCSTRKYCGFHEGNGLHPLMDGHVHAFARFQGVARRGNAGERPATAYRMPGARETTSSSGPSQLACRLRSWNASPARRWRFRCSPAGAASTCRPVPALRPTRPSGRSCIRRRPDPSGDAWWASRLDSFSPRPAPDGPEQRPVGARIEGRRMGETVQPGPFVGHLREPRLAALLFEARSRQSL